LIEPTTHARDRITRIFGFETLGNALRQPRIGLIILLYFLAILSFSGFESMFIRFGLARFPGSFGMDTSVGKATMDQIMASAPIAGRYMFFIGLMAALVQGGLIRRLVPRFGETKLIIIGPLALGVAMTLIGIASTWSFVLVACVLMPFGFGVNNPSLNSLLSRATPAQRQGAFLGLNQSMGSLARVLGPMLGAAAFEYFSPGAPFLVAGVILGVATLLALIYHRRFGAGFSH
jgi:predicted MFS family arabinose efflux permease